MCITHLSNMKATANSHAMYVFSQKRNEAIDPRVWKPGHEIPSAWPWYPAWNFLPRQTPVTSCFQHSFDLYPLLGSCSTFKPSREGVLGPKLHFCISGREEQGSASGRADKTLLLVSKLLQGHTKQGRLPGFSQQELHCQEAEMTQGIHYITQRHKICMHRPCAPVVLEQLPILQWGFCHAHETVQGPLEQAQGLDQVWLALKHPAVWCDMSVYLLGGMGFCAFSFQTHKAGS